ncbi:hypothetical protein [Streptomyces sp. INR7]|nr:hypothetical protein [Streptomyces sp. INR7]
MSFRTAEDRNGLTYGAANLYGWWRLSFGTAEERNVLPTAV